MPKVHEVHIIESLGGGVVQETIEPNEVLIEPIKEEPQKQNEQQEEIRHESWN